MDISDFIVTKKAVTTLEITDSDVMDHMMANYNVRPDKITFHILSNPTLNFYYKFLDMVSTQNWAGVEQSVYEILVDKDGNRKVNPGDTLDHIIVDRISTKVLSYLLKPQRSALILSSPADSAST